jgi:hypothetical protein
MACSTRRMRNAVNAALPGGGAWHVIAKVASLRLLHEARLLAPEGRRPGGSAAGTASTLGWMDPQPAWRYLGDHTEGSPAGT